MYPFQRKCKPMRNAVPEFNFKKTMMFTSEDYKTTTKIQTQINQMKCDSHEHKMNEYDV